MVLVVWKLERLGRSLPDLGGLLEGFRERQIGFKSLTESIRHHVVAGPGVPSKNVTATMRCVKGARITR